MTDIIVLGGKDFPIAPLPLRDMKKALPALTNIGIDTYDGMAAQIDVLFYCMKAAEPTLRLADVEGIVGVTTDELKAAVTKCGVMLGVIMKSSETAAGEVKPQETASL